ncbi:hypothetical protein EOD40_17450 [Flavobacterium sufflavum]|uniref:Uncharacterized protein n=1 Tax=Flavobacterium sufflavum TaxID=1921138 RepID=A0A437KJX9_9FLAO|nr:hypothetical protein [Flavobacterium sufflavum]RVT71196.1 hypothetical protein EOD40_17450 [Flavobacterium sufflavum]
MNNPESVKLEVFTIALKPVAGYENNSFKDLILNIPGVIPENNLFNEFYQLFINRIDEGYTEVRNKAFTLSTNVQEYGYNVTDEIIWGVLKGGVKGSGKTKSPLNNRETEEDLSGNVINDKYFFYLHLPLESSFGYLFFHIYGGESIRKEFIQHIRDLFSIRGKYNKPEPSAILPDSIRDEFKNNSKVVGLSYLTNTLSSSITTDAEFSNLCKEYSIEISIKPKGVNNIPPGKIGILNRVVSGLTFNNFQLSRAQKRVSLQNLSSKKTSTFELDTNDVMPRIYLEGKVPLDVNGTPNFVNLKLFCDDLLRELVAGQYTRIARI